MPRENSGLAIACQPRRNSGGEVLTGVFRATKTAIVANQEQHMG